MIWLRIGLPMALGVLLGWWPTWMLWNAELTTVAEAAHKAEQQAAREMDIQLTERESRRAATLADLEKANAQIDELDRAVAAGTKRVYVRASCPELPAAPNASGVASRTAELDPAYRPVVSELRRRAEAQLALLNLCRAELQQRSVK